MTWDNHCTRLRDILADLYLDKGDAVRLARDAQLSVENIVLSGSSVNFWTSVIEIALNEEKLMLLIRVIRDQNPGNSALRYIERELISQANQRQAQAEIPRLWFYMADREQQEIILQESIQRYYADRSRPLFYVIHGDEHQSHDMFLERIQKEIVPRLLTSGTQEIIVKNYLLRWPKKYSSASQLRAWLLQKLAEQVNPGCARDEAALNDALAYHPGPVMIRLNVLTEDWKHDSPLIPFLKFWNQWPPLVSPHPLLICFSIKYQDMAKSSWLNRRKYQRLKNKIDQDIKSLACEEDPLNHANLHLHTLGQLENISRGEAEDWARREELRRWCPLDKLLNEVSALFTSGDAIPMNFLADELEGILLRQAS